MIKRIVDISEAAYLHLKHQQLVIDKQGDTVGQVPIEDLGVLILQHSAIVLTQQIVIACQKNNVIIIFCDDKHLPYSVILPIAESNTLHNKILKQQVATTEPTRKRLWQQIVQNKIQQQAITLELLGKDSARLHRVAAEVKTGDVGNREAIAAQYYWKRLFGEGFRRDVDMSGVNGLLNYGYAIIRAVVARGICGAGLHPTIGLFHKNQYNALCLADDMMEPFRPWVDFLVFNMAEQGQLEINQESKQVLLGLLNKKVSYKGKKMSLMVSTHYLMADLKRCLNKQKKRLEFPEKIDEVIA
jgi:CRISPR-associated protein Cas1